MTVTLLYQKSENNDLGIYRNDRLYSIFKLIRYWFSLGDIHDYDFIIDLSKTRK